MIEWFKNLTVDDIVSITCAVIGGLFILCGILLHMWMKSKQRKSESEFYEQRTGTDSDTGERYISPISRQTIESMRILIATGISFLLVAAIEVLLIHNWEWLINHPNIIGLNICLLMCIEFLALSFAVSQRRWWCIGFAVTAVIAMIPIIDNHTKPSVGNEAGETAKSPENKHLKQPLQPETAKYTFTLNEIKADKLLNDDKDGKEYDQVRVQLSTNKAIDQFLFNKAMDIRSTDVQKVDMSSDFKEDPNLVPVYVRLIIVDMKGRHNEIQIDKEKRIYCGEDISLVFNAKLLRNNEVLYSLKYSLIKKKP